MRRAAPPAAWASIIHLARFWTSWTKAQHLSATAVRNPDEMLGFGPTIRPKRIVRDCARRNDRSDGKQGFRTMKTAKWMMLCAVFGILSLPVGSGVLAQSPAAEAPAPLNAEELEIL